MTKKILVLAATSQASLEDEGAGMENAHCETLKEAKARAVYYTSEAYARAAEMSEPFGYARVLVNGVNVFDVGA